MHLESVCVCVCVMTKSRLIFLDWDVNSQGPVCGDKALFSRGSLPAAVCGHWRYVHLSPWDWAFLSFCHWKRKLKVIGKLCISPTATFFQEYSGNLSCPQSQNQLVWVYRKSCDFYCSLSFKHPFFSTECDDCCHINQTLTQIHAVTHEGWRLYQWLLSIVM